MKGIIVIIQDSQVIQQSAHSLKVQHKEAVYRRETIVPGNMNAVRVTLTSEARSMTESRTVNAGTREALVSGVLPDNAAPSEDIADVLEATPSAKDEAKLDILLKTIEKITGKKFRFSKIGVTLHRGAGSGQPSAPAGGKPSDPKDLEDRQETPDNRMRLVETYTEMTHSEQEATAVNISGVVKTADGREISLSVGLNMSREYYEENAEYSLSLAPLTDPLVVNYDGNAVDLTESKYAFDLNMDGTTEQISFVSPGSGGFLALDRNGDGIINDGSELFGTVTGNGFSELSGFDEDGNGWIDEGDTIYFDLSVWEKDENGEDRLIALADTGIGAIYLSAVDSPFRITDSENQTLGQVRSTGVYLMEAGGAGTIQQIDLAT